MPYATLVALAALGMAACAPSRSIRQAVPVERYCYRTLGVVDCHAAPLVGEAFRLVGSFDGR